MRGLVRGAVRARRDAALQGLPRRGAGDVRRSARAARERAATDDAQLAGDALRNIGVTHTLAGDLDAAIDELEEARRLLEQVGDLQGIGNTCGTLAQCYSTRGEPMQALGALQRAQSAFERAGNTFDLGLTLNNTGMVYYEIGEFEQALQVYERGLRARARRRQHVRTRRS